MYHLLVFVDNTTLRGAMGIQLGIQTLTEERRRVPYPTTALNIVNISNERTKRISAIYKCQSKNKQTNKKKKHNHMNMYNCEWSKF